MINDEVFVYSVLNLTFFGPALKEIKLQNVLRVGNIPTGIPFKIR